MAGPITITCPGCLEVFPIPSQVVKILGHTVLVRMDRREAYGHMARCPGMAEPGSPAPEQEVSKAVAVPEKKLPDVELAGRINMMLTGGHFVATGGSGACTMCGVTRDACLERLKPAVAAMPGKPCCALCADGNTHPAPFESRGTCAEWGAEHGAKN